MPKALLVVAQQGYQDHEFEGTYQGLTQGGFDVEIASKEAGECTGKFGGTLQATIAMRDVVAESYDRIAFIGGPGAGPLASDADALKLANDAARTGHPLGAICIAPTILAKARVLDGKRATVWDNEGEQIAILEQYGATYTGENVTVDGLIVTGNGPEAALEFGKTLATLQD